MKRIALLLFLVISSCILNGQVVLTKEGIVINNPDTGTWLGDNIPRSEPTVFTYRNNSITSVNKLGYMLQAGDELPLSSNNNLDGQMVTGNKIIWNGNNSSDIITHGLFVAYNINSTLKYNYLEDVPYGIIFKSGTDEGENMTFTSGGCAYNICKNGKFAVRMKGINGVKVYNNTFYSDDGSGWYFILITSNADRPAQSPSTGSKIYNNIFYSTTKIPMIRIESGCLTDFECDYNVYWCTEGEPIFNIDGVTTTWAQWRALGYDAHSILTDPNFIDTIDLVPATRLDLGKNLGTEWETGLSTTASWIAGTSPATTFQNGTWQVGARIYQDPFSVSSVSVNGAAGSTTITTDNGMLQLNALVLPVNATNQSITWSIVNGTGQASISTTGLVTALENGTVTATATANDGSGVFGTLIITISNQVTLVSSISVTGAAGATTITTDKGTLQLNTSVLPANATDQSVTWSIADGAGQASISTTGLVTAEENGTVTATATAIDGSGVFGTLIITISNQVTLVSSISVTGAAGATTITTDNGTLQLNTSVLPANATDQSVTWSIADGAGQASISTTGLVTAEENGTVTATATAIDGSGVFGTLIITISNQVTLVSSISVTGAAGATTITTDNGTLQLNTSVLPANATDQSVTWSIADGTGQAYISTTGLVTAEENGTVTATATAIDGSGVFGTLIITISNQVTLVSFISVTGVGSLSTITTDNGTLQLLSTVLPANATNKTVTWTLGNGTGQASISYTGLVTASENGTVVARATASDGSGVMGMLIITISNQVTLVSSISVTGAAGATTITTDNGTLQLNTSVLPANATDQSVTWSIADGTGQASISTTGLVTAEENGTVTARATANDGSGVFGTLIITISNQVTLVSSISVTGAAGATTITTDNGTLQLNTSVLPANATDQSVTWSIADGTGQASISTTGLVTAEENGTVTATATAIDGSGVFGTLIITISNQVTLVSSISVTEAAGATTITTDNGTLQLNTSVLPANATDQSVTWSIADGTGQASISTTGLVTAEENGTVTARATANDGSGVFGTLIITISNQVTLVSSISVTGAAGATTITTDNGTLQLNTSVLPANATDQSVTWSIADGTGQASISTTGLVTAEENGTVTARATANGGSGVFGTLIITISNQVTPVSFITVTGAAEATTITTDNGTLQLSASVLPANATDQSVTWSIADGTGQAYISTTGLVTAEENGTVTATATAIDGSGVFGTLIITISNQVSSVSAITVTGAGGLSSISEDKGTLQLNATVFPDKASNQTVTWSIVDGTGRATIDPNGLVTAVDNGTVTAIATATDGTDVSGILVITISNQVTLSDGFNENKKKNKSLTLIITGTELKIILNADDILSTAYLYNIQGVMVCTKFAESDTVLFDISKLPSGIYIVMLKKDMNLRAVKIIKP